MQRLEIEALENTNANIVSIDIGRHKYTNEGKKIIDEKFPNRHQLILGNSMNVLTKDEIPNLKYDLIYIDGGHSYKCANSDIINCKKYADENTLLIMDDVIYDEAHIKSWNKQVTKAWTINKNNNFVKETEYFAFEKDRGFALGHYVFL
jgi:hypothetical protein